MCVVVQIDKKLMQVAGMVGRVRQEVGIHSRLKHPSVLELYTFFEDENYVYLVLELCHNGELQRYLKNNNKHLNEDEGGTCMLPNLSLLFYFYFYFHSITQNNIYRWYLVLQCIATLAKMALFS